MTEEKTVAEIIKKKHSEIADPWIKIRTGLSKELEVGGMAQILGVSGPMVVGLLVEFWCWADGHIKNGNAKYVTDVWIDGIVDFPGFAKALEEVGWLVIKEDGISIPNFERHMGISAKKRSETYLRVQKHRNSVTKSSTKCNANVTKKRYKCNKKALPDKMRLDKTFSGSSSKGSAQKNSPVKTSEVEAFFDVWNSLPAPTIKVQNITKDRENTLKAHLQDAWWQEHWNEAVDKIPDLPFLLGDNDKGWILDIDFFLRPNTVLKIIEGKYDKRKDKFLDGIDFMQGLRPGDNGGKEPNND